MGSWQSVEQLQCTSAKNCWGYENTEGGDNPGIISEIPGDSKMKHHLSSRRSLLKDHTGGDKNAEDIKEPSGVWVKDNTSRNLQNGEQGKIHIENLKSSHEKTPQDKSGSIKIPLPIEDPNLRKTEQEEKFYQERKQKLEKKAEELKIELDKSDEKIQYQKDDSPEKRLKLDEDEEEFKNSPPEEKQEKDNLEAENPVSKLPTIKEEVKDDYNASVSEMKNSKFARNNSPELPSKIPLVESNPKASETVNSVIAKSLPEKYNIVKVLGKGEATMLFLLEEAKTSQKACLRMIKKSTYNDDEKEELSNKISNKLMSKELRHPNLVKFKECWSDSTNFYFVQEFLEGQDLFNYIQDVELSE